MHRIERVIPLPNFQVRLHFQDGVQGVADLSHLAGRGVFSCWNESGVFESVRVGSRGELVWKTDIELCPDALYIQITGKRADEIFPNLRESISHA